MILVLFIVFLLFSVLNLLLFQGSVFFSLLAIIVSIAGIGLQIFRKKLPVKLMRLLTVLCILLSVILMWNTRIRAQKGGIQEYEERLHVVQELLLDGELDEAVAELSELEEMYGSDDNTRILRALENLLKGNTENAYGNMSRVSDKTSKLYYAVMERIYIEDPSDESVEKVYSMYAEAAEKWPYWTHMQKYAGIAQFEQGNYAGAEYYLLRAFTQDATDYRVAYYLGAVKYYLGNEEASRQYFNEAIELGADDETCSNIIWYVEKMEER